MAGVHLQNKFYLLYLDHQFAKRWKRQEYEDYSLHISGEKLNYEENWNLEIEWWVLRNGWELKQCCGAQVFLHKFGHRLHLLRAQKSNPFLVFDIFSNCMGTLWFKSWWGIVPQFRYQPALFYVNNLREKKLKTMTLLKDSLSPTKCSKTNIKMYIGVWVYRLH